MPLLAIVIVYGAGISKNGVSKRSSKFCVFYGLLDYIGFILSQMMTHFKHLQGSSTKLIFTVSILMYFDYLHLLIQKKTVFKILERLVTTSIIYCSIIYIVQPGEIIG